MTASQPNGRGTPSSSSAFLAHPSAMKLESEDPERRNIPSSSSSSSAESRRSMERRRSRSRSRRRRRSRRSRSSDRRSSSNSSSSRRGYSDRRRRSRRYRSRSPSLSSSRSRSPSLEEDERFSRRRRSRREMVKAEKNGKDDDDDDDKSGMDDEDWKKDGRRRRRSRRASFDLTDFESDPEFSDIIAAQRKFRSRDGTGREETPNRMQGRSDERTRPEGRRRRETKWERRERRKREELELSEQTFVWGRSTQGSDPAVNSEASLGAGEGTAAAEDEEKKTQQTQEEKESFTLERSGLLEAEEQKTLTGSIQQYAEPQDRAFPDSPWRLFVFRGDSDTPLATFRLEEKRMWLCGREEGLADIPTLHPSCSKQHCVIQFRERPLEGGGGRGGGLGLDDDEIPETVVKPYLIDLGSTNGTFLNGERMDPTRYYELLPKDVIRIGSSTREYVILKG